MSLIVGFDLDMTLLDTRPGVAATYRALTELTGVHVDVDLVVSRLGPPLSHELAHWFPPSGIAEAVTTYRSLYPRYAIGAADPLPGAVDAVAAVRRAGGRVVVISAKLGRFVHQHLDHVGIAVDEVVGDVFADGKTGALRRLGVTWYVGDHVADVRAALAAGPGVGPVAVATGPCSRRELAEAGAAVVLDDLTAFPGWLHRAAVVP